MTWTCASCIVCFSRPGGNELPPNRGVPTANSRETALWEVNDQIPKRIVAKPEAIQCGPSN